MGDFNIDILVSNKTCEGFRKKVETLDLIDICSPTRITEATSTCIEHVPVSSSINLLMHLLKMWYKWSLGVLLVTGENNQSFNEVKKRPLQKLNVSDISSRAFYANHLLEKDYLEKIEIDHDYKIFLEVLVSTLDKIFPLKSFVKTLRKYRPQLMSRKI